MDCYDSPPFAGYIRRDRTSWARLRGTELPRTFGSQVITLINDSGRCANRMTAAEAGRFQIAESRLCEEVAKISK